MDAEFLKYLASLGVGGILAGVIFLVYRKDSKEMHNQWKGQAEIMIAVVKENTRAVTELTMIIKQNGHPHA